MTRSAPVRWSALFDVSRGRLTATVPNFEAASHPVFDLLADVLALSQCRFTTALTPNSVEADVAVSPSLPKGALSDVHDLLVESVSDRARKTGWNAHPPTGQHIDEAGFLPFVVNLLKAGVPPPSIMELARFVSAAMKALNETSQELGHAHLVAVLDRDLPEWPRLWPSSPKSLGPTLVWLLATHLSGDPQRAQIIPRRMQALQLFASVAGVLMEESITAAIDDGLPLKPLLAKRLGISGAELRSLRGACAQERIASGYGRDFVAAVRELKAHSVPLHEWPGNGKPNQPQAWRNTPWLTLREPQLLRPDRFDPQNDEMRDAINAFRDDILCPLVANRARTRFPQQPLSVRNFLYQLRLSSATLLSSPERKDFLTAIRTSLVGPRGSKSFGEAVALWHRRAASVAAMRHEHRADKRGWPAICEPWHGANGVDEIVALTSAAELVEEGYALDHCVGSYYDPCRRGDSQILSLRRNGAYAATVELLLSGGDKDLSLQVGQFKARSNERPGQASYDVLKDFLSAINRGEHRLHRKALIAHRKTMRDAWDGGWSSKRLSLDHARKVFPLYLNLLPRGTPKDFDRWYAATNLDPAIDRLLIRLASGEADEVSDDILW